MDYDYEIIYKEYFFKVYLCVLTISHDENIAEEITQETFFNDLKKLKHLMEIANYILGYVKLQKIHYMTFIKKKRKKQR